MVWFGFLLTVIAGVIVGSFSLPMKKTVRWAWENTWLVWTFTALLGLPWILALITVPDLLSVYKTVPPETLRMVYLFGVVWGLGALLFGQGIVLIGMSLAFAINVGLVTVLGTLVPLVTNPGAVLTPGGMTISAGIAMMVIGVILCAKAGSMKEVQAAKSANSGENKSPSGFGKGLLFCVLAGVFSSMINFAFAFGGQISEAATHAGASAGAAVDAIWAVTLLGGFTTNLIYCVWLLFRKRSWENYRIKGTASYWPLAILMGVLWFGSLPIYGRGAVLMGSLGVSAGWGIYMGLCVLMSNLWGIFTGEWKDGRGRPLQVMISGQIFLLIAIIIIGIGNAL